MLETAPGIEYEVRTGLAGEELREALTHYDGAVCRSGVKITAEALEGNRQLKAIVRAGVGTDNIDKKAATRWGIVVMNTPGGNTLSTAEHTIALMLALSRNIAPAYQSLLEGRWDRKKFMGAQVAGKTLGIVGLGRVGQAVAKRAKALEMNVIGFDPFLSKDAAKEAGIDTVDSVDDMLPKIDYLTVHTPLTDETRGLIGAAEIDKLKPGARLVNVARGGIYDEAALVDALGAGKIAGVALDVYPSEPCTDSPLFGMQGVVCTPHLGASTEDAQTQVATEAVELLVAYLTTGAIRNPVNAASLDPKTLASLRGYLDIAYRLGLLLAGLEPGGIKQCKLLYRGEIASKETKILTSVFAAGLLQKVVGDEVNLVNAEVLLKERGVEVVEELSTDMGSFRSSMAAELVTDAGRHEAMGTLFGQEMPRLVALDGQRLEAYLDGYLLVFRHKDVPGIIGNIGTVLGKHGVNIAQMAVGRTDPGGEAVGVLNLDGEPSAEALDEARKLPSISAVDVVCLPAAGELPKWLQG